MIIWAAFWCFFKKFLIVVRSPKLIHFNSKWAKSKTFVTPFFIPLPPGVMARIEPNCQHWEGWTQHATGRGFGFLTVSFHFLVHRNWNRQCGLGVAGRRPYLLSYSSLFFTPPGALQRVFFPVPCCSELDRLLSCLLWFLVYFWRHTR